MERKLKSGLLILTILITLTTNTHAARPIGLGQYWEFIHAMDNCGVDDEAYPRAICAMYTALWGMDCQTLRDTFAVPEDKFIVEVLPEYMLIQLADAEMLFVSFMSDVTCDSSEDAVSLSWEAGLKYNNSDLCIYVGGTDGYFAGYDPSGAVQLSEIEKAVSFQHVIEANELSYNLGFGEYAEITECVENEQCKLADIPTQYLIASTSDNSWYKSTSSSGNFTFTEDRNIAFVFTDINALKAKLQEIKDGGFEDVKGTEESKIYVYNMSDCTFFKNTTSSGNYQWTLENQFLSAYSFPSEDEAEIIKAELEAYVSEIYIYYFKVEL